MSRLRALAAAAVVACVLPVGAASAAPGLGATCPSQPVQNYTRGASAIFVGTVSDSVGTARTDGQRGALWTQTVAVTRVYKGSVSSDVVSVQTDQIPRQCTVGPLAVASSYVFFVQGDGEPWLAVGGGGTAAASDKLVGQVERLRGAGRAPVAPAKESATFTALDVDPPARLSRVAAPGAALVIIGLIGMLVAGTVGRRSEA